MRSLFEGYKGLDFYFDYQITFNVKAILQRCINYDSLKFNEKV